jgi:hypothetical protein
MDEVAEVGLVLNPNKPIVLQTKFHRQLFWQRANDGKYKSKLGWMDTSGWAVFCAWDQLGKVNWMGTITCRQFRVLSMYTDKSYVSKMCESWTDCDNLMQQ